jgi:hypothetical protein
MSRPAAGYRPSGRKPIPVGFSTLVLQPRQPLDALSCNTHRNARGVTAPGGQGVSPKSRRSCRAWFPFVGRGRELSDEQWAVIGP